jgi:hypothetical protein
MHGYTGGANSGSGDNTMTPMVTFKLIKMNGHVAHSSTLEEQQLAQFLRGSGAAKIVYEKDGEIIEIINEHPVV